METIQYEVKRIAHSYRGANNDLLSALGDCPECGNPLVGSRCTSCNRRSNGYGNCWCGAKAIGPHGYCANHL